MEFYESTYFIVLFPIVVITALLLFFWLFMKETSYDEVLAKQKKDQKLPPAKIDKKKTDKKKNKKKETQNGNLHESDSETALRDFELGDALSSEEEHVVPIIPAETIGSVRERKKKDKKPPKPVVKEPVNKEVNGTKVPVKKPEPVPVTKQPTPPPESTGSKKKTGQKKQKNGQDDAPISPEPKNEQVVPSKKHESVIPLAEVKPQESGSGKKSAPKKKPKTENLSALVDEPFIQPTVYIPLMDNSEPPLVEKKEVVNFEKTPIPIPEVTQKSGGKKGKNVTDKGEHKENAEVKFKDFVATIKSMIFSDDEAMSVVEMLKDKSSSIKDLIHKANKGGSAAALQLQEKEKQLAAARDEATIIKEQCKQLTQELVSEKQKSSLVETKARERISVLEKENGVFQNKLHGSFQEAQQMQVKFQQVREQLENQLAHLKQENGILRDAVSSATNQMESKQSNELIKLRQDYTRLAKDLNDKNSSLAQEEQHKKNQEQVVAGLKAQIQDAERRWEEIESYLRKRESDAEKAQQDFQSKLIAKDAEIQSLHSKLTDTMVSNQQLEQRLLQLMDAGQDDNLQIQVQDLLKQNEALNVQIQKYHSQVQAQSSASVIVEELQKSIEEKEKEIKQMEESLSLERVNFANGEEELKDLRKQNESMNIQIQKYISQVQTQASATVLVEELQKIIEEKDKEIKQMRDAVALEQANFANSGEELKTLQRENISLKSELQKIQAVRNEQEVASQTLEQLESVTEKDEKMRALEKRLEAQLGIVATSQKAQNLWKKQKILKSITESAENSESTMLSKTKVGKKRRDKLKSQSEEKKVACLDNSAAKHKIAIKPKKKRGPVMNILRIKDGTGFTKDLHMRLKEKMENKVACEHEVLIPYAGKSTEELKKEMEELKGLLPDIKEKIEDSKEAQKTADATENAEAAEKVEFSEPPAEETVSKEKTEDTKADDDAEPMKGEEKSAEESKGKDESKEESKGADESKEKSTDETEESDVDFHVSCLTVKDQMNGNGEDPEMERKSTGVPHISQSAPMHGLNETTTQLEPSEMENNAVENLQLEASEDVECDIFEDPVKIEKNTLAFETDELIFNDKVQEYNEYGKVLPNLTALQKDISEVTASTTDTHVISIPQQPIETELDASIIKVDEQVHNAASECVLIFASTDNEKTSEIVQESGTKATTDHSTITDTLSTDEKVETFSLRIMENPNDISVDDSHSKRSTGSINLGSGKNSSTKNQTTELVKTFKVQVESFRESYDDFVAEDKLLDGGFKKEFPDVPAHHVDQLYRLYKRRPRVQSFRTQTENEAPFGDRPASGKTYNDSIAQLMKAKDELDAPEHMSKGLELPVWERFCLARRSKMEYEQKVKQKAQILAEMQEFLYKRREEDWKTRQDIENIMQDLNIVRNEKMKFLLNLTVQFILKQGQVEVENTNLMPNYADAILPHRSVIEDLNSSIRGMGEQKITIMVESNDFRKGIFQLEWEQKKIRMEMEETINVQEKQHERNVKALQKKNS